MMDVHYDRSPSSSLNNVASLIENHDAPLTNNSNTTSSSSTTTTNSSSMTTDDGQRSPRWTPRNPVTGSGIAAPFRRPRKMDVNHRGQRHFCTHTNHSHSHHSLHILSTLYSFNGIPGFSSVLYDFLSCFNLVR